MAMTYLTSSNPIQGITMLREVLVKDPKNELALFNMGMLSIQSGQYERAVERLEELVDINPSHIQGQLLLLTCSVLVANLLSDIANVILDPRLRGR